MASKKGSGNASPVQEKQKSTEQAEKASENVQNESAFASANIGPFAVHGIRIFENEKGMFVNMPSNSYKDAQGNTQYEDVFHPVTKEARGSLVKHVIDGYTHALEQAQTRSQAPVQSSGSQTMQQM